MMTLIIHKIWNCYYSSVPASDAIRRVNRIIVSLYVVATLNVTCFQYFGYSRIGCYSVMTSHFMLLQNRVKK